MYLQKVCENAQTTSGEKRCYLNEIQSIPWNWCV